VLRIGFGLTAGSEQDPMSQAAENIALEGLVGVDLDGRPKAVLAEGWTVSEDGLALRLRLRSNLRFHDGTVANARAIAAALEKSLPERMGPAYDDIASIRVLGDGQLEFRLHRPSVFLLEGLEAQIERPDGPGIGTGPFLIQALTDDRIVMIANENYHGGRPGIDRVVLTQYTSGRTAWADMLRGRVDVLYDVGVDAMQSLASSTEVDIFPFERGYALTVLLNPRHPRLRSPAVRRALNAAIDREALIREALRGHGTPADGPVWPRHWAYCDSLPRFEYAPVPIAPPRTLSLRCMISEPSHERLALALQRQLRAVGVELLLEFVPSKEAVGRLKRHDFDTYLVDAAQGPNMVRPFLLWHSKGSFNWMSGYSNAAVDEALTSIRHATSDAAYAAGVAAFQRAILEDPPAIFLAWRERARAVSRRFAVPAGPGEDVLGALQLWRPHAGAAHAAVRQ
jgi:peptide/nickel transport system substrate-binding protein